MQKVLILVLSYNQPPFSDLMEAQKISWASLYHEDITTVFYYGGNGKDEVVNAYTKDEKILHSDFKFNITDQYYLMAGKLRKALEWALHMKWDLIFRTNSSCVVSKERLLEFAKTMPSKNVYAGWTIEDTNDGGGACVSGTGIWLSRDYAEILSKEIDIEKEIEEDVYVSRILRSHGAVAIDDKSRVDYPQQMWKDIKKAYYVRCKSSDDRMVDVANMKKVYELMIR